MVSVRDHEAFAAKHLPDLGQDIKDFKIFSWRLNNWKKLDKKLTSKKFECGGHKWRILLFPSGNATKTPRNDVISLYLDYAEPKKTPKGWHVWVQFALVISNPHDPTIYTVSNAIHCFIAKECDWGFTRFVEVRKLFKVQEGNMRPTIENESADITVYVRVLEENLTAKVITDDTFTNHDGFDLATFDEKSWLPSDLPTFRVLKQENYSAFKRRVAHHFNYHESQIRLWVLVSRRNKTVRPDTHIPENDPTLTVEKIVEKIRKNMAEGQNDLRLYLDVITNPFKPDPPPQSIMIFLKHFDTSKQSLYGVGRVYMARESMVGDLVPVINERMRWTDSTPLKLYEEVRPGLIELMKTKLSFIRSGIQDGDVICFQVDVSKKDIHDIESQGLYLNPVQYYDFLLNRVMILFRPKFEDSDPDGEFCLTLSKKQNYDTMAVKAGKYLRHDPIKLRFTTTDPTTGLPKMVVKQSSNQSISEIMIYLSYANPTTVVILYEKLDVSIVELEWKCSLKVTWTGIYNKEEGTYAFLLPKTRKIRIFEISEDGKNQKEYTGSEMIGNIPDPVDLYAEEVPQEEVEANGSDKVIGVFHFSKELQRTHGVPFNFVVKLGEKFVDTKKRLQARIGVSDNEFVEYRFALIQVPTFKVHPYVKDEDTIYKHQFAPEVVLGLDHVDKSGKPRSRESPLLKLN